MAQWSRALDEERMREEAGSSQRVGGVVLRRKLGRVSKICWRNENGGEVSKIYKSKKIFF